MRCPQARIYFSLKASRRVPSEKLPIIVMQRTCRQCRKLFKVHCYKPYVTSPTPQFFGFDCPYCAEPLREELPGAIFGSKAWDRGNSRLPVLPFS